MCPFHLPCPPPRHSRAPTTAPPAATPHTRPRLGPPTLTWTLHTGGRGRATRACSSTMPMSDAAANLIASWLWKWPLVEPRQEPLPGHAIEPSGDLHTIAILIGPDHCLGPGRLDARDRTWVKPQRAHLLLCALDVSCGQNMVGR
jgi:hypothetical protein